MRRREGDGVGDGDGGRQDIRGDRGDRVRSRIARAAPRYPDGGVFSDTPDLAKPGRSLFRVRHGARPARAPRVRLSSRRWICPRGRAAGAVGAAAVAFPACQGRLRHATRCQSWGRCFTSAWVGRGFTGRVCARGSNRNAWRMCDDSEAGCNLPP